MLMVSAIADCAFYQHRVPTGHALITQLIVLYRHSVPTGQFRPILPLAFELVLLRFAHPDLWLTRRTFYPPLSICEKTMDLLGESAGFSPLVRLQLITERCSPWKILVKDSSGCGNVPEFAFGKSGNSGLSDPPLAE
jgi:hypothetical protein